MPLVINSLRGGHTHTCANTQTHTHRRSWTEAILRNQVTGWHVPGLKISWSSSYTQKMNNNSCIKGDGSAIIYCNKALII